MRRVTSGVGGDGGRLGPDAVCRGGVPGRSIAGFLGASAQGDLQTNTSKSLNTGGPSSQSCRCQARWEMRKGLGMLEGADTQRRGMAGRDRDRDPPMTDFPGRQQACGVTRKPLGAAPLKTHKVILRLSLVRKRILGRLALCILSLQFWERNPTPPRKQQWCAKCDVAHC
jgi:hypothetical protein